MDAKVVDQFLKHGFLVFDGQFCKVLFSERGGSLARYFR
jgi:hypothetical protein